MKDKLNGLDEPVYEFSIQANKKNPAKAGHASNLTGHVKSGFLLPNILSGISWIQPSPDIPDKCYYITNSHPPDYPD